MAVLVLNYNGKHLLSECLSSLMSQTYQDFDVTVIDNASTDGSIEYIATQFPEVGLIQNDSNLLFARGNNVGLARLMPEYPMLVLLNNDTKVAPTWLEELVKPAVKPEVGVVTSAIKQNSQWYYGWSLNLWTGTVLGIKSAPPGQTEFPVFHACGCSMLIKSEVLQQVGLFDGEYGAYFEDLDLSWRTWLAGFQVVCASKSMVDHYVGSTSNKINFSLHSSERNRLLTYYKNLSGRTLWKVFPIMILFRLARWLTFGCNLAFLRGLIEGIRWLPAYQKKRAEVQGLRNVSDGQIFSINQNAAIQNLWKSIV